MPRRELQALADVPPLGEGGTRAVNRYYMAKPEAFIKYGPWLWCARDPKYFEQPKILFHRLRKKLPRQLVAAMDKSKAVNRHALSNLILVQGHPEDELWAVLALVNSDLANWWFVYRYLFTVSGTFGEGFPWTHVRAGQAT